ncbi:hypothetical protein BASA62_009567 [Batrachochytrium salamandrivorans]|nr:hypothetical protein BASA62_009567 [Batrachochytrium salamandrivorans]
MPLCHSVSVLGRLAAYRQYIQSAVHKRASLWTVGLNAYTPSPSEDSNSTIHTASCSRYMSTNTSLSSLLSLQRNRLRALGRSLGISHLRDRVEVDGLLKNYLNPHPSLLHDDGTISLDTIFPAHVQVPISKLKDVPIDRFHAVVALLGISQWRNRSIVIADLVQHVVNSPRALTGNILVTLGLSTDDSIPFWRTPSPSFIVKITYRFQSLTDWELRRMCSSVNVSSSKGHLELVNELLAKLTKKELVGLIRHHLTYVAPDMIIDGVISLAALSKPVVTQSAITE